MTWMMRGGGVCFFGDVWVSEGGCECRTVWVKGTPCLVVLGMNILSRHMAVSKYTKMNEWNRGVRNCNSTLLPTFLWLDTMVAFHKFLVKITVTLFTFRWPSFVDMRTQFRREFATHFDPIYCSSGKVAGKSNSFWSDFMLTKKISGKSRLILIHF